MPTISDLIQKQSLPLDLKVVMSQQRIREFFVQMEGQVYISHSGGKDSTVLTDLVHSVYPNVPVRFMDTGLEFPESRKFCQACGAEIMRPERSFVDVVTKYGYPVITKDVAETVYYARKILNGKEAPRSSRTTIRKRKELLGTRAYIDYRDGVKVHPSRFNKAKWLPLAYETDFLISNRCCFYLKKSDFLKLSYNEHLYPFVGSTAEESVQRTSSWLMYGCNCFKEGKAISRPLSFWLEQDILRYIKEHNLKLNPVYGDIVWDDLQKKFSITGYKRTGCMFCGFGLNYKGNESKLSDLARSHPAQYEFCMRGGQYIANPFFDPDAPVMDQGWKNWNPKKIWVPSKEGLGMKHVFDRLNDLYGKDFIKY